MHRIQVQLTAGQERSLRELSRLRGMSISALIREGVDSIISDTARDPSEHDPALALIGMVGPGGPGDIAERHDDYLADIYEEDLRK
jgi:hypothetical protein